MTTENLTLWVLDPALSEALTKLPYVTIKNYEWNWKEFHIDLLKNLVKGTAPDLVEVGTTWTNRLVQEGVLLNITQFSTEYQHAASTFFPRILFSCRDVFQNDQYYALPLLADIRVLFYNREYLDSYLVNHPNAFKNWQAFEEMCQALKERLPQRVIAWSLDVIAHQDLLPWVWSAGGDFITLTHQVLLDSGRTQEAICRLARLILTDCAPVPPNPLFNNPGRIRTQFEVGRIGLMAGALWLTHTPGWQDRFGATLYPPDIFPTAFVGGSNLAIVRKYGNNEHAKAYQSAKDFLASMVGVDHQLMLA
jgi:ABC-type glycerol-3-phosphate transport system substrate-binding protein